MCFISLLGTFKYLQEQPAKKAAPTIALSNSITCRFADSLRTNNGTLGIFAGLAWDLHFKRLVTVRIEKI
jgi:hypothetical protein